MATKSMRMIAQRMPRELHQMVRYAVGCVVCELDRSIPLTAELGLPNSKVGSMR